MSPDPKAARRQRMLNSPVGPLLWSLSWPMSLGLFSVIAFNFVDTLYVGRLGEDELAAMGYCFPIIFGLSAIAIGIGNGATSVVARRIGAGEFDHARQLIFNTLLFVAGYAVILSGVISLLSETAFKFLGAPDRLQPIIHQYMDVWYLGLPFLILPIVMNGLIRASGEAMVPSVLMVVAALINAVLSPIWVFGLFGAPELGMAGAAWATIVARGTIAGLCIGYLLKEGLVDVSRRALGHFFGCVRDVLTYGAPAFAAQLVSPIAGAIITRLLSGAGEHTVAAFAVGARVEALALVPFFALQAGIGPFIGQNVGAGRIGRLRQAERSVLLFCGLWGGIGAAIMLIFGEDVAGWFSQDPQIVALADRFIGLVAFGLWGAGLMIVAVGIFNPLGYPNYGMGLSMFRYLALYAGGALTITLVFLRRVEPIAIFAAAPLSYAITGIVAAILVHKRLTRPKDARGPREPHPRKIVGHDDLRPYRHPDELLSDEQRVRQAD